MKVIARALKMSVTESAAPTSQATVLSVVPDGEWHAFHVDELTAAARGTEWMDLAEDDLHALPFNLAAGARLAAVDVGVGDDTFETLLNGSVLGAAAVPGNPEVVGVLTNVDATFADHAGFSFLETNRSSHCFELSGRLLASALFGADARSVRSAARHNVTRRTSNTLMPFGALALLALRIRRS